MSAYVIGKVKVNDPDTYKKYTAKTPDIIKRHGGKFLVRGGDVQCYEGEQFSDRIVVIEFPNQQAVQSWYNDPDYQQAMVYRHAASQGQLLVVDGYDETA